MTLPMKQRLNIRKEHNVRRYCRNDYVSQSLSDSESDFDWHYQTSSFPSPMTKQSDVKRSSGEFGKVKNGINLRKVRSVIQSVMMLEIPKLVITIFSNSWTMRQS